MRLLALLLAAAAVATACSSDAAVPGLPATEVRATDALVSAVRATQAEESATAAFGFLDESQVGTTSITGEIDTTLDGRRASGTFELSVLGRTSRGVVRVVDGVRYVSTEDEQGWTRDDVAADPSTDEVAARTEGLLALPVDELLDEGPDRVAGVATTRHGFTLPDAEVGDELATDRAGQVWIDDEGRLRQFQLTRTAQRGGVSRVVAELVTFESFDVGPIEVEAPPPSDVSQTSAARQE